MFKFDKSYFIIFFGFLFAFISLITYVIDRPGHDLRYAIDSTKAEKELGWDRTYTFEKGIEETVNWYLNNQEWIEEIKNGNYKNSYKG